MGKQTVYSLPLQRKELSAWHSASDPGPKMPQLGRVSATRSGSETWGSARQAGGGSSRTGAGNVACLSEVCSSVSSLTHPLADGFIHSFVRSFTQPTSVDLSLWLGRNRGGRGQGWRQTAPDPVPFHVILIMTGAPGTHTECCGGPREDRPQEAEAAASLEDTQELLGQNNAQMHGARTWPAGAQVSGRRRR